MLTIQKKNNQLTAEEVLLFQSEIISNLETSQDLMLKLEKKSLTKKEFDELKRKLHNIKGNSNFLKLSLACEAAHIIENLVNAISNKTYKKSNLIDLILESIAVLNEYFNTLDIDDDGIIKDDKIELEILLKKLRLFDDIEVKEEQTAPVEQTVESRRESSSKNNGDVEIIIKKDYPKFDFENADKSTLNDFISEANEMLSDIAQILLKLEENKNNKEVINELFRILHTLKGSSGMVDLVSVNYIAHSLEEILDLARTDKIEVSSRIVDVMFAGIDKIQELIKHVENNIEPNENVDKLLTKIYFAKENKSFSEPINNPVVEKEETEKEAEPKIIVEKVITDDGNNKTEITEQPKSGAKQAASLQQQSLRIDVKKLDDVMNQMGELVIEKIKLQTYIKDFLNYEGRLSRLKDELVEGEIKSDALSDKLIEIIEEVERQRDKLLFISEGFERLSSELQDSVMKMRLVPISQIFSRFPRVVRDLSKQLKKKINFEISGEETEIDKGLIERLVDPLVHIIRNSIDHGVEEESIRKKIGKKVEGYIHLQAFYRGDNVIIQVEDDGAGVNLDKVKTKALEKGLTDKDSLSRMDKEEIMMFLFQPGFSTADKVTDLSGRGVGMDVVKRTIEDLNGTVAIKSEEGKGTSIIITIPLTLAIMQVLLTRLENRVLAIPLYIIQETVFCKRKEIYELSDKVVFNLRGNVIPLILLKDVLGVSGKSIMDFQDSDFEDKSIPVVIMKLGEKQYGIIVDILEGKQEIVLKSLGTLINKAPFVSGATIMGDGTVILILDIISIIRESNKYKFVKKIEELKPVKELVLTSNKKALVVDDAMAVRLYLKKILNELGIEVEEAENGKIGLLKAKKSKYDLVTIDFLMPEMDGYQLCEELRKLNEYKKTPLIAVSSKGEKVDKIKGFELGIDEYLVKPVEKDLFISVVKKFI